MKKDCILLKLNILKKEDASIYNGIHANYQDQFQAASLWEGSNHEEFLGGFDRKCIKINMDAKKMGTFSKYRGGYHLIGQCQLSKRKTHETLLSIKVSMVFEIHKPSQSFILQAFFVSLNCLIICKERQTPLIHTSLN